VQSAVAVQLEFEERTGMDTHLPTMPNLPGAELACRRPIDANADCPWRDGCPVRHIVDQGFEAAAISSIAEYVARKGCVAQPPDSSA
jgi:hypothetical protein